MRKAQRRWRGKKGKRSPPTAILALYTPPPPLLEPPSLLWSSPKVWISVQAANGDMVGSEYDILLPAYSLHFLRFLTPFELLIRIHSFIFYCLGRCGRIITIALFLIKEVVAIPAAKG
jgi:hypothetical protein